MSLVPRLQPIPRENEVVETTRKLTSQWFEYLNRLRDIIAFFVTYVHIVDGDPNGVEVGSVGHIALRRDGGAGTTLYVKEAGTDTMANWVAK